MTTKHTADQTFVRVLNLSLVLRHIHNEAPLSRAQIAAVTGLNKSTVSSLVDDLLKRGLICETGLNSIGTGRPATLLEINPKAGSIIGVELGVDFVTVALTDFMGNIRWRKKLNLDPKNTQEEIIEHMLSLVDEAVQTCTDPKDLLGLGLSIPGTVNTEQGLLVFAPNLYWRNVPLKKIFSEQTGLKVYIENDANAAAIAEHLFGAARQINDFFFVFAGVGIGGGLFLNGKLYRGRNGFAGEIGHSPIMADLPATTCHCGNRGCWETYASQSSIIQRIQSYLDAKKNSVIPSLLANGQKVLSIPVVKQAADMGDQVAQEALTQAGRAIGKGIAGLINVFDPEKVILGGPLSIFGDTLLSAIRSSVSNNNLSGLKRNTEILLSNFASDASLIGAISIVVDDILSNPTQKEVIAWEADNKLDHPNSKSIN